MKKGYLPKVNLKEKSTFKMINNIPLYELFHRNSELNSLTKYNFSNIISSALSDNEFINEISNTKSLYKEVRTIELPIPNPLLTSLNFFDTILKRRSVRNFSDDSITLEELSTILFYSVGITGEYIETKNYPHIDLKAYPSAGGLYPLDLYILINNVQEIDKGIYYYDESNNSLKLVVKNFDSSRFHEITLSYNLSTEAAFTVYILGELKLTGYKYGDRAYRFMNLEAGHIAQNLYLASTAIGAGAVASGGFLDEEILKLIALNNKDIFVLYEIIIGKPNLNVDYRFLPERHT